MGEKSAMAIHLPPVFSMRQAQHPQPCAKVVPKENAAVHRKAAFRFAFAQWQPPQVEQLPVQDSAGSDTVIGSPPFIAVLMIASI